MRLLSVYVVLVAVAAMFCSCASINNGVGANFYNAQVQYWQGYEKVELDIEKPNEISDDADGLMLAWKNKRAARRSARSHFWDMQGQTYWKPLPSLEGEFSGEVAMLSRAALKYYRGILFNSRQDEAIRFLIVGQNYGLNTTLAPGAKEWMFLPAGEYNVQFFKGNNPWPYERGWHFVNTGENDGEVDGQVCDFGIIAP